MKDATIKSFSYKQGSIFPNVTQLFIFLYLCVGGVGDISLYLLSVCQTLNL